MVTPQPDHFGGLALANDSGVWSWVKLSRFTRFQVIVDNQQDSTEMPEEIGAGDAEFLLREILSFAKNGLAPRLLGGGHGRLRTPSGDAVFCAPPNTAPFI